MLRYRVNYKIQKNATDITLSVAFFYNNAIQNRKKHPHVNGERQNRSEEAKRSKSFLKESSIESIRFVFITGFSL
ncbi:hypothetical protein PAECIP111890_03442 [Paenibacillus sp. JJ-223]|nr:hypothetical protein PAECIP111890_03442 [Paenibacillus sp. JJ-223]